MTDKISIHPKIKILIICVVLTVMTLIVFGQLKQYDFVNFDDHIYVTDNRYIQSGITLEGIRWAFTTTYAEFWHPLTWLSLMVDYQLFGLNAGGYHLTNVILHILSTLLLFWLFNRMTGALWRSAFIAAFFALHPLHVESVAWIAERKDVLSAFFWMLTLCLYVFYTEKPVIQRYLPVLICFACGLMSKSMVVTLPVVLILLDYWPLGRLKLWATPVDSMNEGKTGASGISLTTRTQKKKKKDQTPPDARKSNISITARKTSLGQFWEKTPFFVLSAVFSIITLYAQQKPFELHYPLDSRFANAIISFVKYLILMAWPRGLAVFYPFPFHISAWQVAGAILLIITITAAVIIFIKRWPFLTVGWLWYAITVLPVIGIIQIGDFAMADRYTYLPAIGISIMLAWGIPLLFQRAGSGKKILLPAAISVLAILAVLSWQQIRYWKNSLELFNHALQVTEDNSLMRNSLGLAFAEDGKIKEAIGHYQVALELNPYYEKAHINLGVALASEGKIEEAIAHYLAAINVHPNNPFVHCNIGSALALTGKYKEAEEHYRTAITLKPDYDDAFYNYANLLLKQGMVEEAITQYQHAVSVNSSHQEARSNLAAVLFRQGKFPQAIEHYLEILKINPSSFRALNNLGVSFEKILQHDNAIYYYRQALIVEPSNPGVHFNLGIALVNKGDLEEAIEQFRSAVSLNPEFEQAHRMLKVVQKMKSEKH